VVNVRAKAPSDRNVALGLLIGGLVGVGVGAAILIPTVVAASNIHGGGEASSFGAFFLLIPASLGALIGLAGAIVATVGGVNLANANTSVSVEARAPNPDETNTVRAW
jgi:hypothetical protein